MAHKRLHTILTVNVRVIQTCDNAAKYYHGKCVFVAFATLCDTITNNLLVNTNF